MSLSAHQLTTKSNVKFQTTILAGLVYFSQRGIFLSRQFTVMWICKCALGNSCIGYDIRRKSIEPNSTSKLLQESKGCLSFIYLT